MRIWRDIPDQATVQRSFSPTMKNSAATGQLLAVVARYHVIEKDKYENLLPRSQALASVISKANLSNFGVQINNFDKEALARLQKRCQAKMSYIKLLQDYYDKNQEELQDPEALWKKILTPKEENRTSIGLRQGSRIEKFDPIHRDFEVNIDRNNNNEPAIAGMDEASKHVVSWYHSIKIGDTTAPLWLYLENTEFSLSSTTAKKIDTIPYLTKEMREQVYAIKPALNKTYLCMSILKGDVFEWNKFDTSWVKAGMAEKGTNKTALAFVWSLDKELFADLHNPSQTANRPWRRFHHSSLLGGELVLLAGMISGRNGLVNYVSNGSGHYQPGTKQLRKFVLYLQKRQWLTTDAVIDDHGPMKYFSVAEYLEWSGAQIG